MVLDATHLCDQSFWEVMDHFKGPVWASHSNCRSIVNHNRQFSDDQIKALIERGAVVGQPLDAWMMVPGWERGKSTPESTKVNLENMIDHMDHIAIGTDLDGGFGTEQGPSDVHSIADLQKLPTLLSKRGYNSEDIVKVMNGNWTRILKETLQ